MKKNTHPELHSIEATCGCGNVVQIVSTLSKNQHLDICSACHPFYIGQQKLVDTGGRIDKFRSRFGASLIKSE